MRSRLLPRIAVTVVVTAGTLVGGYAIGRLFHEEPAPEVALPPMTAGIPVVKLAGIGPDAPTTTAPPAGAPGAPSSTTTELGRAAYTGVVRELTVAARPKGPIGASVQPGTDPATPDASPSIGVEPIPVSGHFADPCAPSDGSDPPPDCPEGTMSTILFLRAPAPLDLFAMPHPPRPGAVPVTGWANCTDQEVGGSAVVGVSSNNPLADATITWWKTTDYAHPTTMHFRTSDADRAAFDAWFATASGYDLDHRVQHCLVLRGLERGSNYQYRVEATDVFGHSATWRQGGFYAIEDRARPPTVVGPWNSTVLLTGWSKHDSTLMAVAYPLHDGDAPDGACQRFRDAGAGPADDSADLEYRAGEVASRELPGSELRDPSYRFDPTYTTVTSLRFTGLQTGTRYSICVGSAPGNRPSYDAHLMYDAETLVVTTPNRLLPKVTVAEVDAGRSFDLQMGITAAGSGEPCWGLREIGRFTSGSHPLDPAPPICDFSSGSTAAGRFSDGMNVQVTLGLPQSVDSTFRLPIRIPTCEGPCADRATEWYRIPLPQVRVGSQMCSGDCDPPAAMRSAGTALIRVDFVQGSSDGTSSWSVDQPRQISTTPLPGEPDHPRIDAWQRPVVSGGIHPTVTVPVVADRPVTASLTAGTIDGSDPCVADPSATPTVTDTTLSERHTLTLPGLCAGQGYTLTLTVTDAAGHVGVFGEGAEFWAWPRVTTPPVTARLEVSLDIGPFPNGGAYIENAGALINSRAITWWPADLGCQSGTAHPPTYRVDVPVTNTNHIVLTAGADGAYETSGGVARCTGRVGGWNGTVVLRATLSYAELVGGGTITLSSTPSDAFPLTATITVSEAPRGG